MNITGQLQVNKFSIISTSDDVFTLTNNLKFKLNIHLKTLLPVLKINLKKLMIKSLVNVKKRSSLTDKPSQFLNILQKS